MHPAILWKRLDEGLAQCELCSHFCVLALGKSGKCGVRVNQEGTLYTLVKDKIAALNVDPIEKKPLFHFLPKSTTLSLGTMGCNFACTFCQNYTLSQPPKHGRPIYGEEISPKQLVSFARQYNCASISYTYSEPTIFIEIVLETAQLAKKNNLKNILVTNGFQSKKCLQTLNAYIDAANVDLKSFQESFYSSYCDGHLKPVLNNLELIKKMGWWLELTTLIIPGLNDSEQELKQIASFIYNHLGPDTPWHISRYHPAYKKHLPPTPTSTLEKAYTIGKEIGLNYVYLGNTPGHQTENTFCPFCGKVLIKRYGFQVQEIRITHNSCSFCQQKIAGIFA
ncbi:MAG: AmmeMemoRadiSam system radical SAM enzyme [Desulfonauticus sp.]|nr:AmmeMemoRadiSam system radical SAM enzyme [Desulfonauticus sp.]